MIPEIDAFKDKLRYERKFVVPGVGPRDLDWMLRNHPLSFSRAYPSRTINNIYLDSPDLGCFQENRDGVGFRLKFRVRWYGDLLGPVHGAQLEVKFKRNFLGGKVRATLEDFAFDDSFRSDTLRPLFRSMKCSEGLRQAVLSLEPTLVNPYRRENYRSCDRRFMVTLDSQIYYLRPSSAGDSWRRRIREEQGLVVELKSSEDDEPRVTEALKGFPMRIGKNSKYVRGVDSLAI